MPFIDGPQPNRRHGMPAAPVRLVHPHRIQHLHRCIGAQPCAEHGNRRIGIQHMMMCPGRIGGLRRPPIGYLALQRHIACQHQLRSSLVPKRVRLQHPMIKVLTQHRHPFAVPRCHRAVERFHPDARRRNQRTRGCDVGAHLVAEHALQIGCGQIGDIARTVVFEPKSVPLRRKPTRLHHRQRHILYGRLRTTPGQHEADEHRAPHPVCFGHSHLVTIVSAQLGGRYVVFTKRVRANTASTTHSLRHTPRAAPRQLQRPAPECPPAAGSSVARAATPCLTHTPPPRNPAMGRYFITPVRDNRLPAVHAHHTIWDSTISEHACTSAHYPSKISFPHKPPILIVSLSNLRFSASYPHTSYAGMLRDRFSFHPSTQKTRSRRVCDDLWTEISPR